MKQIKVGMDISQTAHTGGVSVYTKELAEKLSKVPDIDMVYFYSSLRKPFKGNLKNVKKFRLPPTLFEVLFNKIRNIPIDNFIGRVDVFHSSDWVQPPTKAKKVTTYHDVIPLKFPQWSSPKIVEVHKRRLSLVEREIDMVIAVSESTKKDLMSVSNIHESKITVIYEAVSEEFKVYPEDEVEKFRKEMKLPEKFVLAIAGVGERKNLTRVKKAVGDLPLVILGQTISGLNNTQVALLYNCADVLLYPSLYEGFGLPILEAMNCGVPVVTSSISSMPEVAGDAGIYVDPLDLDDIKAKLNKTLEDKNFRDEKIKLGFKQSKKFSWEKTVRGTVDVYKKLIEG